MSQNIAGRLRDLLAEIETPQSPPERRPVFEHITTYREFRSYSALHDCEMIRLSVAGPHNAEYFVMIEAASGKRLRERRTEALENIEAAIAQGCQPGEVRVMEGA